MNISNSRYQRAILISLAAGLFMDIILIFISSNGYQAHSVVLAQSTGADGMEPSRNGRGVWNVPYGPDPEQRMDVYFPTHPVNAPVLFMVHGGAWMIGDKTMSRVVTNKVAHWIPEGYIFISIDYRMLPEAE